jgi:hypothetical protein
MRQMRAEELYESLVVAATASSVPDDPVVHERAKSEWLRQFVTSFGNDEGEESTTFNGTIPQTLMMFNGELMSSAARVQPGSYLMEVASSQRSPQQTIQRLFLAGLARRPTRDELDVANKLLMARATDQLASRRRGDGNLLSPSAEALEDLWWAILNSNEFITNH